jgi:hypothetical protein
MESADVEGRYHFLRCVQGNEYAKSEAYPTPYIPGDWAGNSYATSGCPGTCSDRLMNPTNFVV